VSEYKTFKVSYLDSDGMQVTSTEKFKDEDGVLAKEWAEDWAYSLSEKSGFTLTEITKT